MLLLLFDTIWIMWPLFAHTLPFLSIAFMETPGIVVAPFPTLLPHFGYSGGLANRDYSWRRVGCTYLPEKLSLWQALSYSRKRAL